jgi:hypothetical protein
MTENMQTVKQENISVPFDTFRGALEYADYLERRNKTLEQREAKREAQRKKNRLDGSKRQDAIVWVNAQLKRHEKLIELQKNQYTKWRSLKANEAHKPVPLTKLKYTDIKVGRALNLSLCPKGTHAGIRQETLAKKLKVSQKTIQRAILRLQSEGIYFAERQRQKSNPSRLGIYHYIPGLWRQKSDVPIVTPVDTESTPLSIDLNHIQDLNILESVKPNRMGEVAVDSPRHKQNAALTPQAEISRPGWKAILSHGSPEASEATPSPQSDPIPLPGQEKKRAESRDAKPQGEGRRGGDRRLTNHGKAGPIPWSGKSQRSGNALGMSPIVRWGGSVLGGKAKVRSVPQASGCSCYPTSPEVFNCQEKILLTITFSEGAASRCQPIH